MDEEKGPRAISPKPPDVGDPGRPPAPSGLESANDYPRTDSRPSLGKSRSEAASSRLTFPSSSRWFDQTVVVLYHICPAAADVLQTFKQVDQC